MNDHKPRRAADPSASGQAWKGAVALLDASTPQQFVNAVAALGRTALGDPELAVLLCSSDDEVVSSSSGAPANEGPRPPPRPSQPTPLLSNGVNGAEVCWLLDDQWHAQLIASATPDASTALELPQLAGFISRCWQSRAKDTDGRLDPGAAAGRPASRVCHDLRSSLHNLSLASQLLGPHVSDKGRSLLERLTRNVETMATLIDELSSGQS